jgi:hypothetical protein
MKFYFDYIYYRVYQVFLKWDGTKGYRALCAVTMIQSVLFAELMLLSLRIFFSHEQIRPFAKSLGLASLFIMVIFYILNYRVYNEKYEKMREYWEHESKNKRIFRGFLVIISMLMPWVLLYLMGLFT